MTECFAPLDLDSIPNVLNELEEAFYDIPFENSDFQNRTFVVAGQQTPARAYRAVGLRMFAKIRAVKEYMIARERSKVDIEEKEDRMALPETNKYDRRRLELDILQIRESEKWSEKLLNDALRELDCLYAEFRALPKYTREQFELEEMEHFEAKLGRQLQGGGAYESLLNMREDAPCMGERIQRALESIKDLKRISA